jgi:hypothetical protein
MLGSADASDMEELLALLDSDADEEDPETAALIASSMADIYGQ